MKMMNAKWDRVSIGEVVNELKTTTQNPIADVAHDLGVGVARGFAHLLPFVVGAEGLPALLPVRTVVEAQHVNQIRLVAADNRVAEKYRTHSEPLEDRDFTAIEHRNFAPQAHRAVRFVHAEFEESRRALGVGVGRLHLRRAAEGAD